jgi:hypothetical protein
MTLELYLHSFCIKAFHFLHICLILYIILNNAYYPIKLVCFDFSRSSIMSGFVRGTTSTEKSGAAMSFTESPIKIFGQAKVKITELFEEIKIYIKETESIIGGMQPITCCFCGNVSPWSACDDVLQIFGPFGLACCL